MIDEMRPFIRRAVAVLVCQIGAVTASTSAVVMWSTGLRPSLGTGSRSKDERRQLLGTVPVDSVGGGLEVAFPALAVQLVTHEDGSGR